MYKLKKNRYYKGILVNSFGLPISGTKNRTTDNSKDRKRDFYNISFKNYIDKNSPKNLIVIYDIPHERKKERDWFRRQLIKFNFKMIQKSVWVGPSPLPKNFLKYITEIKLRENVKTFKLAKSYQI